MHRFSVLKTTSKTRPPFFVRTTDLTPLLILDGRLARNVDPKLQPSPSILRLYQYCPVGLFVVCQDPIILIQTTRLLQYLCGAGLTPGARRGPLRCALLDFATSVEEEAQKRRNKEVRVSFNPQIPKTRTLMSFKRCSGFCKKIF